MEVSKSKKRKSGVEDGDDQPNKKTKTDEAGGIHIFSMLYTHTHTHTHTQCVAFGTDKSVLFMEVTSKCSDIHVCTCMLHYSLSLYCVCLHRDVVCW